MSPFSILHFLFLPEVYFESKNTIFFISYFPSGSKLITSPRVVVSFGPAPLGPGCGGVPYRVSNELICFIIIIRSISLSVPFINSSISFRQTVAVSLNSVTNIYEMNHISFIDMLLWQSFHNIVERLTANDTLTETLINKFHCIYLKSVAERHFQELKMT